MDQQLVLHSPFQFERHNKAFTCYCEVVIWPDGKIEYAVPSHQEKLIREYMNKHHLTREECEKEWMNDFDWLDKAMKDLQLVFVWYSYFRANFELTEKQKQALADLQKYKCCCFEEEV